MPKLSDFSDSAFVGLGKPWAGHAGAVTMPGARAVTAGCHGGGGAWGASASRACSRSRISSGV